MTDDDVIVVGAGPTGLTLACELAMRGIRVGLVERRADTPNMTRAFAVHARTLELLDSRGMADELLPHGVQIHEVAPAPGAVLDLRKLDSRYPMLLIAPQSWTERVLEARAKELGVHVVRGAEVVGLNQDANGVTVDLGDGTSLSTKYVVGCDGAHSAVRRLVGVDFVGKQYETHILLADVKIPNPPEEGLFARNSVEGVVLVVPFGDGWFRLIVWDRLREQAPLDEPVTETEMKDAMIRIAGSDLGVKEMRWSSRFLSERKQARRYQVGRVFLAGDAAHVHSPLGGQGMNTGIGDAMNLGWKLAEAVHGTAPAGLLETYQAERHPVGATVLRLTDAFNTLVLGTSALRRLLRRVAVTAILGLPIGRRVMGGLLTGIGIRYSRPRGAHGLVGRRMPDVDCGAQRLFELLRTGRFVLLTRTTVDVELPGVACGVHGDPSLPAAILIRPDGYVAWASDAVPDEATIRAAVDQWTLISNPASRA
ncbi:MAG: 2-polyprenyl-6-methoxyphenol hydroxylase-like oxidoreductase [Mycobacterium sp.]|nr:2-polyprenyl-6-methoxyphenol hydroxylase-like oxidoreductase [Mycobacterium sp.]